MEAPQLADLQLDDDDLDLVDSIPEAIAEAIQIVVRARPGITGWLTQACNKLQIVIAAATAIPLQRTQTMVDRLTAAMAELDKRYEKLNTANRRLFRLDENNHERRQRAIDDTDERYSTLTDQAYRALAGVTVLPPAAAEGVPGPARAVAKSVEALRPRDLLSLDFSPTELADWTTRWTAYYHASRFDLLPIQTQQSYLQSCIKADFWLMIRQRRHNNTPIFEDDDDDESCMKFLKEEFDQRYPLIQRRYELFSFKQAKNQAYSEYSARLRDLGEAAQLEGMTETDFYVFRLVTGLYDTKLRSKILDIADDKFTLAEVHRVARKHESTMTCTEALEEESRVVHSLTRKAFQKKASSKVQGTGDKIAEMQQKGLCYRCAKPVHQEGTKCPHRGDTCGNCSKKGHISAACAGTAQAPKPEKPNNQAKQANQETSDEDSDDAGFNRTNYVFQVSDGDGPRE
jgi:hypothetical protein